MWSFCWPATSPPCLPAPSSPSGWPGADPVGFSGSYAADDVTFLLKPVELAPTPVAEKERLIQSGARHYSEMLSAEEAPDATYLALFHQALAANRGRFAGDLARLAKALHRDRPPGEIVLASLARAGTPVGVLLRRALVRLGRPVAHYSLSIIRDRGIDRAALDWMLARHAADRMVFVDGWTGKGAIAGELVASLGREHAGGAAVPAPELVAVADLAGVAALAATAADYLIPSAILNAVVSGLVSRTVLNDDVVGPGEFHACVVQHHLAGHDLSRRFVDALMPDLEAALADAAVAPAVWGEGDRRDLADTSADCVARLAARHGLKDRNRVKPGIGESTRALLRRLPEHLYLADPSAPDVAHLLHLAQTRGAAWSHDPDLPYRAAVVIRTLGRD
ncbi:MAG: cysteine protease StiP family protein [Rhodospirillaceae bacterium]|nr:cysteine protease StiP family protein [Rhodospirillaceae bacterium]